jgi:hypothetical protein
MSLRRLRAGELLAGAGAVCVIVALFEPSYERNGGQVDAWETFGPAVVLLLVAAGVALWLVLSTIAERSVAMPVAAGVWCVLFGFIAVVCATIRVLERPGHASALCFGVWLALAGAVAILVGAWLALRDERTSRYDPATPEPRPRP